MTKHKVGTSEEWRAARLELLKEEKALTRRGDEVTRKRLELPWVRVEKEYRFARAVEKNPGIQETDGLDFSVGVVVR